jgi:hypothetical protein
MLKTYSKSGIKTIQLKSFNETTYFEKLANVLSEQPGLTCDKLSQFLKINVNVMKEQVQQAEKEGFICIDESNEGHRYYDNLILKFKF